LQVALIIDTLEAEFIIASLVTHSLSALLKYTPSSNMLAPRVSSQPLYFRPFLRKAGKDR
jgi:hypothetical protein